MQMQNVQNLLQVWLLLTALIPLIVLDDVHSIPVDYRGHVQRLLCDSLQERILDHDLESLPLLVNIRQSSQRS